MTVLVGLEDRRAWQGVGVCLGLNITGTVPLSPRSQASAESQLTTEIECEGLIENTTTSTRARARPTHAYMTWKYPNDIPHLP